MSNEWQGYKEHRTREELQALLRHGHYIPACRGWTREYVDKHYPGWTWNELMEIWRAAGIVVRRPGGAPPACDIRVKAIHFNGPRSFAVEWEDGTVTRS